MWKAIGSPKRVTAPPWSRVHATPVMHDDVPVLRRIVKAKLIGQRSTFNGHLEQSPYSIRPTMARIHEAALLHTRLPAASYSASYSRWPGLLRIHFFPGPTLPPRDPLHSLFVWWNANGRRPSSSSAHAPQGSATGNNTSSTQEPPKEGSVTMDRFAVGRSCIGKTFVALVYAG